ncbi:sensor histidine kinase [Butyricicoccus faecihominis]|uniref:sensor histidine kinase n=1 Tax=Butyricicoccaceae TaxID=3085642 RepID=UPI00247AE7A4|nr:MULTISPECIES: sensor histidine kinase [Butyricicoccaceae]MCQ5128361.1 sensor histidine kinase [Butyricicoccus faecihominis]WNX83203.1 sensor histidine kinase [Agathobaculum sp. NTUH-O15-33]
MKAKRKKLPLTLIAVVLCCALVVVPVLCSIIYFTTSVSTRLENTARETVTFYLDQFADHSSSILDTLRNSIYYLMSDDRTQSIMRREDMPDQLERLAVEEGLSRAFFLGNQLDPSVVTGIYLVKNGRQYLSLLRSGIFLGTANRILNVYEQCGTENSARDLYTLPDQPDYCYFIVDFLDLETMVPLGKVIIELNAAHLVDTSYIDSIYQQAAVLLRSTDGRVLAAPDSEAFSTAATDAGEGYLDVEGKSYYHASRVLSPSRVQVDIFVPKSEIFETTNETVKVYVFFTAVVLVITLLLGAGVLYLVYKPVRQMLQKIDRLATGDLTARMEDTPYRETERMAETFNDMADRLEELFDEVYEKGLLLRDAEFNLLESQIRPHFIFNVLELINMRCLAAGEPGICHTVSNLAQLMRANITHKNKQTISLQEELRYVRYYLELQKERFEDKLNYSIDLEDPDMLGYYLPKLTIQPLVENSIVHGLENKRGGGTVRVSIWEETEAMCIRVSDDGIGFDPSLVNLDISESADESTRHNHVALGNINRRIQLLYGRQYGMQVTSSPGRGTDILLTLPVDRGPSPEERSAPDAESDDC